MPRWISHILDLRRAPARVFSKNDGLYIPFLLTKIRYIGIMDHGILKNDALCTRRLFLQAAGAVMVGTTCGRAFLGAAEMERRQDSPIQVGIFLSTFSRRTLEDRLDAAKASGVECVHMSMDCAGLRAMPDAIPSELSRRIRRETSARGMGVACLQANFNMSHPDAEQRKAGLRQLRVLAESCSEMGTSKIHICTGTRDRGSMWRRHPDNNTLEAWKDMSACVREAAVIAKETGVVLGFEPEVNNVVDSAKKARQLLDEIGSEHLKVTIDPANIFHAGELPRMVEILDETFGLLGKDIVMGHAKDLNRDGDAGHLAAGQGKLDYDRYMALLRQYGFKGPLLLHGLSEAQAPGCVTFLRKKLA